MRLVKTNGVETGQAIRKAAIKVIAKRGFQSASLREIAKEVGIQAPSLYNYIKSKEKLLFELLKVPVSGMIADYKRKTASMTDPVARLQAYVGVHLDFFLNSQLDVFIGNMELRSLSPAHYRIITGLREEYAHLLTEIIEDGVKAKVFHAKEPRVVTLVMLGMLSGACNWYRPDGPLTIAQLTELHLEMAFKMLSERTKTVCRRTK